MAGIPGHATIKRTFREVAPSSILVRFRNPRHQDYLLSARSKLLKLTKGKIYVEPGHLVKGNHRATRSNDRIGESSTSKLEQVGVRIQLSRLPNRSQKLALGRRTVHPIPIGLDRPKRFSDATGRAVKNQTILTKIERALGVKLRGKDKGQPLGGPKKK
ncbi:unnamed protein product [Echinostoma caproni]|uniref:Mitoc_mL59 domain-containing protein n=1 Tax=Echinostoma caproni TaxID=27848 RepID=A0A183AYV7_9TREM|nr:unnamed protein product [Echinostoma caproni]